MGYEAAINKAWDELLSLSSQVSLSVKFLADEYTVDLKEKKILSLACNVPPKDHLIILILHYLSHKLKGLPILTSEWISIKEMEGGEIYHPVFRKRALEPILRKYGNNPEGILEVLERLPAKRVNQGDVGIVLEVFENVPVLITLWRQDEEFGPEVNMLFDRSITKIYCTEDVVVLASFIAGSI